MNQCIIMSHISSKDPMLDKHNEPEIMGWINVLKKSFIRLIRKNKSQR